MAATACQPKPDNEASRLPWKRRGEEGVDEQSVTGQEHPWFRVLADGEPRTGELLGLDVDQKDCTFVVNATPIVDARGANRGVLTSFEDITDMEQKRVQLSEMLEQLKSDLEAHKKNLESRRDMLLKAK